MPKQLPDHWFKPMSGENQRLVTDEQVEFENKQLNFETSGELPFILEESIEYTSNEGKKTRKMPTCIWLDLESPGSLPKTMPKTSRALVLTYDPGEPAVSYRWTGWSSRLQENHRSF